MKKLQVLLVAFTLGTMSLFANNIETPEVSKDEIRQQIVELIQSTDFNFDNNTNVNITFTFNTEGEIVVLKVNSISKDVLNFVRTNLNGVKLENPGKVNREYTMPLSVVSK
ncbi:hypothetical protein [Lutibacter sp.]|uniref:hypothetical protein n=1 Tax=Lutibacter sp. TaxID=1925666 RepID=UPI003562A60C